MGEGAGVSVYSIQRGKRILHSVESPALRELVRFLSCPMHSPLNVEL